MQNELIIIRYGEIGIKSPKVRRRFEKKLISNIKNVVEGKIRLNQGRIFLYPENFHDALESLGKIFGIVSFSRAISTKTDFDSIKETLREYIQNLISENLFSTSKSFAIRSRRVGTHDFTSQEMASFCGSVVVEMTGAPVDLSNPDLEIYVEVRENETYIFHEKIRSLGGIPLGTQGKLVSLLSGGIDSPVATFLMMKRGCDVILLHFNNYPYTSRSNEKVLKLVRKLEEYSSGSKLKFIEVKYGDFLRKCVDNAPGRLTCVLCKTGMYRIAEEVAKRENAMAIVDGSSLGQVASQTLPNILATRYPTSMPVLSPLIGLDKVEIEAIAKKIGTFDISILHDGGCKAVPRYPETNADLYKVLDALNDIDLDREVQKVLLSLE